jgi:MSHA biogenesis protein MshN
MSLINSVLRDLDARKFEGPGARPIQQHVRVVPEQRDKRGRRWGAVAAAVVAAAAAAAGNALWVNSSGKTPARPAVAVVAGSAAAVVPNVSPVVTPIVAPVQAPVQASMPTAVIAPPASTPTPAPAPEPAPAARLAVKNEKDPISPRGAARPAATGTAASTAFASVASTLVSAEAGVTPVAPETGGTKPAPPTLPQKRVTEPSPQERADNEYAQAVELLRQGMHGAAIQRLEEVVRMSTRHDAARQKLVSALIDVGRKDDAIGYAQEGLAQHVAQPALAMTLARLQVERGELRPAIATLERTLPYDTSRTGYEAFLAALLQRDEQHKQAVEHYLVALQKAPEAGLWWMGLGISYQALQRSGQALDAFKRAKATGSLNAELSAFVDTRLGQLER